MNVLLTTSPAPTRAAFSTSEKRPPLEVGMLIAALEQRGHTVYFEDQYLSPWPIFDNALYLRTRDIDIVGIYSNTLCLQGTLNLVRKLQYLRERGFWKGRIAVGGPHTSYGSAELPEYIDHICIGEGDITFCEIVEGTEKERIVRGKPVMDMDALPMPAWRHFIWRGYDWTSQWNAKAPVYTMNTSRGCPFSCTFCSVKGVWGRTYRFMSAERVCEDVAIMRRYYGMRTAYFREDHFTLNPRRTVEFCEKLLTKGEKLDWMCESRADSVDEPGVLALMAKAGCTAIYLGIESGSQARLDALKKNETVEQFEFVIREARRVGIRTYASMIYGTPGETAEDIRLTEDFLARVKPDHIGRNIFCGLPGSELYDTLRESGGYDYEDENGILYPKGYETRAMEMYEGREYYRVVSEALGTPSPEKPNQVTRPARWETARPLVSVIMPARNAAAFVRDAASSILGQTLKDFEFIITDDGSDDETWQALESCRDPRIFLHRNETPEGITPTLNAMLDRARGEFIARMDADDLSLPHRFAAQVDYMRVHPEVWACGGSYVIFYEEQQTHIIPECHDELKASLLFTCPLPHPFVMLRGDLFRKHGIRYDEKMTCAQDYELWQRLALNYPEARFANVPAVIGRYRKHPTAISVGRLKEQQHMATRAQMQTFAALGFSSTDPLIAAHAFLYHGKALANKADMARVFEWALALKRANEKTGLFCRSFFEGNLLSRLLRIAERHPQYAGVSAKLLPAWR